MLYSQGNEPVRIQCAFIDTPEVKRITEYIGAQRAYANAYLLPEYVGPDSEPTDLSDFDPSERARLVPRSCRDSGKRRNKVRHHSCSVSSN